VVATTGRTEAEALAIFTGQNPQRRLLDATEVAGAVLWLCGDEARGVNGAAIPISGGETG
jgi:NAD(P)-dependent dehydrogenase (short-subunit alcohol dehydrogenase family)